MTISTYDFAGGAGDVAAPFALPGTPHPISAGQIQLTGSGTGTGVASDYRESIDTTVLANDQYAKLVVVSAPGANDVLCITLRANGAGDGYKAQWNGFNGAFEFLRSDTTSYTETSIRSSIAGSLATSDVFEARMVGSVLSIYKNSILVGDSNTDTTYTSGRASLVIYTEGSSPTVDDWETGDFGSGASIGWVVA